MAQIWALFSENYFHWNIKYCSTNYFYIFYFQKTCAKYLKYFSKDLWRKALFLHEKLNCKWYNTFYVNGDRFALKIDQFLIKIGSNLAQNWTIFLAISRGAFLARNVSQNHFSFSREMREMCKSSLNGEGTSDDWSALVKIPTIVELYFKNCSGITNEVIENYLCDLHVKLPMLQKIEKC